MAKITKTSTPHDERIRQRAYEIWEQQGRPHGQDGHHWEQASLEIKDGKATVTTSGSDQPTVKKTTTAKAAPAKAASPAKATQPAGKVQLVASSSKAGKRG